MEINERITKVIEYSGLSPAEFAAEIDIQRSSISHITSGRNKPSLDFITKIKNRFSEIEWEWLIRGQGKMIASQKEEEKTISEKSKNSNFPTLFDDDNFDAKSENEIQKENLRETVISHQTSEKEILNDSQQLEKKTKNIRRIVFFYENGSFESYEN